VILATVSSDRDFHADVCAVLSGKVRFASAWDFSYADILRLQAAPGDQRYLVIVDFADPASGLAAARALTGRAQFTTIAVGSGNTPEELLRLMHAGVRDVLPHFSAREILQAANRAATPSGPVGEVLADLYAFVPAKPGCGATTVATYATAAAARLSDEPMLLLDFDVRLGITTFLLKADGTRTILDALQHVHRMDRDLWLSAVTQIGNLHLLGSGPVDLSEPIAPEQFTLLLDFAIRQYSAVAVDLPGSMEDHECAALLRAERVFLVCTPEVGALHLARRKAQWFQDLRITDRVSVVLNRRERQDSLSVEEVERILQLPVRHTLPSDVKEISRVVQKGTIPDGSSALARQIAKIAEDIVPARRAGKKLTPVRRFVQYFSVGPERDVPAERRP
jgi:pilus assembly protein CpaE